MSFWLIFGSFLIAPSYALSVTSQFLGQMKGHVKMHNRGKFHLYSIFGCEVIKFQIFSWRGSTHEIGHFGGFLGPNSPPPGKDCPIWLKFLPEVVLKDIKIVWRILEKFNFFLKREILKVCTFCPTLSPIYPLKMTDIGEIISNAIQKFSHLAIQIS